MQLSLRHSLSGIAFQLGEPIYCEDTEADDRVDREACLRINARSMAIAPLRAGETIIGALKVVSDRTHAFDARDRSNLQVVVEALGTVMQRHAAMEQLTTSEAQYRLLFNNNPHPMWVYDAASLRILVVNRAAVRKYGYSEQEFLGMSMPALYASGDPGIVETNLKHAQRGDLPPAVALHRKKSGDFIDVELSSDAITFNHAPALLALASDITERLRAERGLAQASQRLHHLAFYDALTQLPNRLLFLDRLQHVLASIPPGKLSGALLFLDLDNFKAINDSFGHEAGDLLLQ